MWSGMLVGGSVVVYRTEWLRVTLVLMSMMGVNKVDEQVNERYGYDVT